MTQPWGGVEPPSDSSTQPQPATEPVWSQQAYGSTEVLDATGDPAAAAAGAPARGGRRRGLMIGAGVLAVAAVGAGVALAASQLGDGGAQPEEAVPASAVAFVAVDLDPSAGQKLDALRFTRKFPGAASRIGSDDDLRRALFEALKQDDALTGDWATDVAPWLGQRAGLAVLPPKASGEDPGVVVLLAVTDQAKAKTGLAKVAGSDVSCDVTPDFAVCADDAAVARQAVADAAKSPLSKVKRYTDDVDALGDRGIARGWLDFAGLKDAVPASGGIDLGSALGGTELTGRGAFALRFDGPNLALTGQVVGVAPPKVSGSVGADDLPADTLAVYGFSGGDTLAGYAYDELRKVADQLGATAELDAQLQQFQSQYGIAIPSDIGKALGERSAVLFGGMEAGSPRVAARLSGDRVSIDKLLGAVRDVGGPQVAKATAGTDTVLASTQAYADEVARGKGLGSAKAFTAAVPRAKDAQGLLYVNLAGLLGSVGDEMGVSAEARKNLAPLSALGMSTRRDGDRFTYDVRLTTR